MEKKNSKEVKLDTKPSNPDKIPYDQLENLARQLHAQCATLQKELNEARTALLEINQIGILLSIIKEGENFNPSFISRCADKIEEIITRALNEDDKEQQEQSKDNA